MNSVFVSAFMTNVNKREDYNIEKYIENGKKLIDIQVKKIIFLEKEIYNKYFANDTINSEFTKFILFEKSENYLYEHISKITNFCVLGNHNKDTLEYIFIQCHKTEWIRKAIESNLYESDQFIWIDFGIYYIIKDELKFTQAILNIEKKYFSKIRIASIWDPNIDKNIDPYRYINWYFAGGIFGGNKENLIKFANLMKDKCLSIIEEKKTITWEVNIWQLIYKENSGFFDFYYANHNLSLLENY
jgi:hypothetical protein